MTRLLLRTMATVLAATLGASASAQPNVHSWTIDPSHTAAQFAVRHLLVTTVHGQFEKLSGTIQYDGNELRTLSVHVTIDAASINTRVQMRDNDLRSANFFDVRKYPTITFVSTNVESVDDGEFRLRGDLTIHGVTREVVLDVQGPMVPAQQGTMIRTRASATTKINRHDYGLHYGRLVEGASIVGDEVTITIDVEALRPAN